MNDLHIAQTARELSLRPGQVRATAELLGEGSTVPFVARYRKEATGSLDEVAIAAIRDRLAQLEALDQRRQAITTSLQERNLLTDALAAKLGAARCAEALGQTKEARQLYEELRPVVQGSSWETEVSVRYLVLSRMTEVNTNVPATFPK